MSFLRKIIGDFGVKKTRLILLTILVFFCLSGSAGTENFENNFAEPFNESIYSEIEAFELYAPFLDESQVNGTGTFFEVNNNNYFDVTLFSLVPISATLLVTGNMIECDIESAPDENSSIIIIFGMVPLATYYMYEDSYRNLTEFTANSNGNYTYKQDLSKPHHVWIQTSPSTYFISDNTTGGDCEGRSIGVWNPATKTCTLTTNLNESVEIESNNIKLDCANHSITGSDTGYGVYIHQKEGITIKDCTINKFTTAIFISNSNNNDLLNNISTNINGDGFRLLNSYKNTLINNKANARAAGFFLQGSSYENTLVDNVATSCFTGFFLVGPSYKNTLIDNNAISNISVNIYLNRSNENSLISNTTTSNQYGIYLNDANNNILIDNTLKLHSMWGIVLRYSINNILIGNTIKSNNTGIFLYYSGTSHQIEYNNIVDNINYNLENNQAEDVSVKYNWWGTNNESEISAKIYDYFDNSLLVELLILTLG